MQPGFPGPQDSHDRGSQSQDSPIKKWHGTGLTPKPKNSAASMPGKKAKKLVLHSEPERHIIGMPSEPNDNRFGWQFYWLLELCSIKIDLSFGR